MPRVDRSQQTNLKKATTTGLIQRSAASGGDEDFIQTPAEAVRLLLSAESFDGEIWEPACGRGAISSVLVEYGYLVESTDLIDRGFGTGGMDFFKQTRGRSNIVTNPPYSLMATFVPHAIDLVERKLALLLPLAALGGSQRRIKAINHRVPSRVWCFLKKVPWVDFNDQPHPSAFPHCWVVWDKSDDSDSGETKLGWLHA